MAIMIKYIGGKYGTGDIILDGCRGEESPVRTKGHLQAVYLSPYYPFKVELCGTI